MPTRVELNYAGFNEYRKSAEMTALLKELADGIATRAGDGYASDKNNSLLKAVSGG